jgi:hypothetical protein
VQRGNDCAVREREASFAKGFYRDVVAELGAHLLHTASRQVVDGDQAPVTVPGRNADSVDRGGLSICLPRCAGPNDGDPAGQRCNGNQPENNPSHTEPPAQSTHA